MLPPQPVIDLSCTVAATAKALVVARKVSAWSGVCGAILLAGPVIRSVCVFDVLMNEGYAAESGVCVYVCMLDWNVGAYAFVCGSPTPRLKTRDVTAL